MTFVEQNLPKNVKISVIVHDSKKLRNTVFDGFTDFFSVLPDCISKCLWSTESQRRNHAGPCENCCGLPYIF